jgi:hypothetical protein
VTRVLRTPNRSRSDFAVIDVVLLIVGAQEHYLVMQDVLQLYGTHALCQSTFDKAWGADPTHTRTRYSITHIIGLASPQFDDTTHRVGIQGIAWNVWFISSGHLPLVSCRAPALRASQR